MNIIERFHANAPQTELERKFFKFLSIEENLAVVIGFCQHAQEVHEAGFDNYGADIIIAMMRWHSDLRTKGESKFKINNNLKPFLARFAEASGSVPVGFFRTRVQRPNAEDARRRTLDAAKRIMGLKEEDLTSLEGAE